MIVTVAVTVGVAATVAVAVAVTVTVTVTVTVAVAVAVAVVGTDAGRDGSVAGLLIVPACSAASRPLRAGCAGASGGRSQPGPRLRAPVVGLGTTALVRSANRSRDQWHSSSLI